MKIRNKQAVLSYLLRNPFYSHILKQKLLIPCLDFVLRGENENYETIKKIIIALIEVRCSISLLLWLLYIIINILI